MSSGLTLLVDASSLIFRAFFSTPDTVRAPDGTQINGAYGFMRMFARLIADHNPDFVACATDMDWRPAWRVELIDSYKTHRTEMSSVQQVAEDELSVQMPILFEILELAGISVVGLPDYEAEDVIGTLAARAAGPTAIVSGDRDLFQLVHDPDIFILYPKRGVSVVDRVDEAYIETNYGIPGRAYRDFAILRGDPSDGLPGVPGIGQKIAAALLTRYGSLDAIVAEAKRGAAGVAMDKVRRSLDYIERATKVVTIPTDLDIPPVDLARPRARPTGRFFEAAKESGLLGPAKTLADALSPRVS